MNLLQAFSVAFAFSFVGTIPPGTINLTIVQMGLEHRVQPAWRFAAASAIIEYFYGWIAVAFQDQLFGLGPFTAYFELISAVVMLVFGITGLISAKSTAQSSNDKNRISGGFRRGILLGILNPLALPFWIAMTAYLKSQGWIIIQTPSELHAYLVGVSMGGFAVLMIFFFLARKVLHIFEGKSIVKIIPPIILITLGCYALVRYALS